MLDILLSVLVAASSAAAPATHVYVSNEDGGDVAIVDPNAGSVVARIPVGKRPRGIRIAPDGRTLYVALSGSPKAGPGVDESKLPPADRAADGIGVVDIETRRLVKVLPSGQDPEAFDLSPDGKTLYVSNEETAEVTVLDVPSGVVRARVAVGEEPEGVTVSPDGRAVYVTCEADNEVVVIDARRLRVVARVATGPRPRSVAFTRDGSAAFVTTENVPAVTVVDAARHRAIGPLAITSRAGKPLPPRPMGSVMSPDGKTVYVSNGRGGSVAVIDVAARRVTRMIEDVGARPWGIGVSGDGRTVFTANGPSGDVSVIDAASGNVLRRIAVGGSPWGIAVGPAPAVRAGAQPPQRVTILFDAFGPPSGLEKDWGFAALVEYGGRRVLFDTGNDAGIFARNVERLGIDLGRLDAVVISHRHGDHTSGLGHLLQVNKDVTIWTPREAAFFKSEAPRDFLARHPDLPLGLRYFEGGEPARWVSGTPWTDAKFAHVTTTTEILPGFYALTTQSRKPGTLEMNEVSLAVRTPKGLAVLVGCAHPGVENILAQAARIDARLHIVAGGFHLVLTPREEVQRVADVLHRDLKVERVAPGHCTSELGFAVLLDRFEERFVEAGLGTVIALP